MAPSFLLISKLFPSSVPDSSLVEVSWPMGERAFYDWYLNSFRRSPNTPSSWPWRSTGGKSSGPTNPGFFHRFLGITNNWIWRIFEYRKKLILEFRRKFFEFRRQVLLAEAIWSFIGKQSIFALKLYKNCWIFQFRFEIYLSLEKNLELSSPWVLQKSLKKTWTNPPDWMKTSWRGCLTFSLPPPLLEGVSWWPLTALADFCVESAEHFGQSAPHHGQVDEEEGDAQNRQEHGQHLASWRPGTFSITSLQCEKKMLA